MSWPLPEGVIDTLGMHDATYELPEQVVRAARAAHRVEGLPRHEAVEHVLVLGTGASGLAGDVLRNVGGPFCALPIVVHRGYSLPSFVSPATLCIAISYTGDSEETVEAADEAAAAGAHMAVVAGGGALGERAEQWGAPYVKVEEAPAGRAAIGSLAVPPLILLERIGAFPLATDYVDRAVHQLRRRRDQLQVADNVAVRLARRVGRTIPLVLGGGGLGTVAAQRWKNQVNQNAKAPAMASVVPDLCHDEISGWGQHGDMTRQVFTEISLRHDGEHPQLARRFDAVEELLDEVVADRHEVRAEGDGELAQLFDLFLVGDVFSLYLAAELEVDPGPTDAADRIESAVTG